MESLSYQTGKYYASCYSVFKKHKVGDSCIILLNLPTIIRSVVQSAKECTQFNILSIGSGDGTEDIKVATIVQEELQRNEKYRDVKIFLRGIEPNEYFKGLYDKAIEDLPVPLKDRSVFDVRGNTFEEYKGQNDDLRFDLVLFIHSMYYLDAEESLKYCFDRVLKENGKVMVILDISSPVSTVNSADGVHERGDLEMKYEKVTKAVEKNKWRSSDVMHEYEMEFTQVLDEKSHEGILLLDFWMHEVDFRVKAKKEQLDHVLKVLEENTTLKNGKRFGIVVERMYIISK